ncbi:hypothetical protein B5E92_06730 [Erysipelatoclostridium sp. An15]|uniref:hypothetical protein n=1 Tax=Erysipelatoclostridium sp. An15 TaxID=1965566 RepID=UPI000B379ED4|nr:hypothetical protein [Erysipelatoclostridium sp. An15]OUQ07675.1 hypothetical protein B5E92_06730 [Erysipelatoclostridium sp. An15]
MKKIIRKTITFLPSPVLFFLEWVIKKQNIREYICSIRLKKFYRKTNFSKINIQNYKLCIINQGTWDYPLFQVCFIRNMLQNITYCLANGYRPIIEVYNSEKINLWTQFLKQPYEGCKEIKNEEIKKASICNVKEAPFYFPIFPTKKDIAYFNKLIKTFIVLNEETKNYFFQEEKEILGKNKRIVGVLCRGTDYTDNQPQGHPIQPEVTEVVAMVKEKMDEYNCSYVYLATDEEKIKSIFEKEFPGIVLTNKRKYYDEFYNIKSKTGGDATRISWIHFNRENDSYYKSLEYISSINLLSKCNLLIAGNCGGSRAALYLNNNKYEFFHLFNKGLYE